MKRGLPIPRETEGDNRATEMIRVWLAHNDLHVWLNLGMWKGPEDSEVDEREAWGFLLSDLSRHIANGLMQQYGWDYDATRDHIRASFLKNFDDKTGGVAGGFRDDRDLD